MLTSGRFKPEVTERNRAMSCTAPIPQRLSQDIPGTGNTLRRLRNPTHRYGPQGPDGKW